MSLTGPLGAPTVILIDKLGFCCVLDFLRVGRVLLAMFNPMKMVIVGDGSIGKVCHLVVEGAFQLLIMLTFVRRTRRFVLMSLESMLPAL